MWELLMQLINGINIGSIYGLIALGYSMVYGIAKLINFAHGDIIMISAYFTYFFYVNLKLPVFLAIMLAISISALVGAIIEKLAYKPLRNASRITLLITAIGISYFLQSIFQLIFTSNPKAFPTLFKLPPLVINDQLSISGINYLTIVVSLILMVSLELFINRTKLGKAMRACSEDLEASQLMGINIDYITTLTFILGSALAAVAGILYCSSYPTINPYLGALPGIKAFIAAVLGGIGNIKGALLGGFILGLIEALSKAYLSSSFSDTIVFGILILLLVFKPTGILGKNRREKV